MKIPKMLFVIFILLVSITSLQAQSDKIRIILKQPPPNLLGVKELWMMDITNSTSENINIYLTGKAAESKKGLIVSGKSKVITVAPGTKQYGYNDFKSGGEVNWKDKSVQEVLLRTGNVPEGEYIICVTAFFENNEIAAQETCIEQGIQLMGSISLISPEDKGEIDPDTLPGIMFAWTPLPKGGPYSLKIVELKGQESPDVAIKEFRAILEKTEIKTTSYQYGLADPKLEKGKTYAWQVNANGIFSDVSVFGITTTLDKNDSCKCGNWKSNQVTATDISVNPPKTKILNCGDTFDNVKQLSNVNFSFPDYVCNPGTCNALYTWNIKGPPSGGTIQNGTGNQIIGANFSIPGSYVVSMNASCGGNICDSCKFYVNVVEQKSDCPKFIASAHSIECHNFFTSGNYDFKIAVTNSDISMGNISLVSMTAGMTINSYSPATANPNTSAMVSGNATGSGTSLCIKVIFSTVKGNACDTIICFNLPDCGNLQQGNVTIDPSIQINPVFYPCDCSNGVLKNWNFTEGMIPGDIGHGGNVNFWSANYNLSDPQVGGGMGCCDSGFIQFWGRNPQTRCEILEQNGINIQRWHKYKISVCVKIPPIAGTEYYARLVVAFSNTPFTVWPPTATTAGILGSTATTSIPPINSPGITNTSWETYSFEWTASSDFDRIFLYPTNDNVGYESVISWLHMDNVCIEDMGINLSTNQHHFNDSIQYFTDTSHIYINPNITTGLHIGDSYQGGIIFYLNAAGDHGLIAAPEDIGCNIPWGTSTTSQIGATSGNGQLNTNAIVAFYGTGNYAASLCDQFVLNGYSDWYLPSSVEMSTLLLNKDIIGGFNCPYYYWTSNESWTGGPNLKGICQNPMSPINQVGPLTQQCGVRPIRVF